MSYVARIQYTYIFTELGTSTYVSKNTRMYSNEVLEFFYFENNFGMYSIIRTDDIRYEYGYRINFRVAMFQK
jgi:hypothetical protein